MEDGFLPCSPLAHAIRLDVSRRRCMTKNILALLLLSGSLFVAACNTVEGAGRDVQSAGEAVEDAAD